MISNSVTEMCSQFEKSEFAFVVSAIAHTVETQDAEKFHALATAIVVNGWLPAGFEYALDIGNGAMFDMFVQWGLYLN